MVSLLECVFAAEVYYIDNNLVVNEFLFSIKCNDCLVFLSYRFSQEYNHRVVLTATFMQRYDLETVQDVPLLL